MEIFDYQDESLSFEKRVKDLVSRMTVEEKATQLVYNSPAISRLGVPSYNWWSEALHGVARAGVATVFPQAIGLAATFDEKLIYDVAEVISIEARAKFHEFQRKGDHGIYKGLTFWSPNINIFRDPRWGRGHETYGEDPYLTGRLGVSFIKGLQGQDAKYLRTAACAKHFAVHSGPEDERHSFDAVVSPKDLRETYLPAFKECVKEANNDIDCSAMTPEKAQALGVGFVHQELNLAEELNVAENIFMGRLPYKNKMLGIIDYQKLYRSTEAILQKLGSKVKPTDIVEKLPTAQKQLLEIGRAISLDARIVIFDEPTTSLGNDDVAALFKIINTLKQDGVAIIYISHRLKEIFEICDHATVLRDGQYIGTVVNVKSVSQNTLITMMVGRDITELFPKEYGQIGETILEIQELSDYAGKVKNVSFYANRGEIVGFAGLVGSGRTEIVRMLFGADPIYKGNIKIRGQRATINTPKDAINQGICLLTEDRKNQGLSLIMSVTENINMTNMQDAILNNSKLRAIAEKFRVSLQIKTASVDTKVGNLSGGNQQKVVLAKWLNTASEIFIFDEPTKGIDVGAKSEIYQIMNQLVKENKTVIMISSELPELLGMADRIYVMCEGRLTGEIFQQDATQGKIMALATVGGHNVEPKAQ